MLTPAWQLSGLAMVAGLLIGAAIWVLIQRRESPEKKERKRREFVNERGRFAYGTITDVDAASVYYSYSVAGVEYRTSQDVSQLSRLLPGDPDRLIGPVTLKYLPRNPANSIILCETWSGLRMLTPKEMSQ
jgi:hypothetical protein